MEYLAAAQSLAYVFTACCWFAVWRSPTIERRSFAVNYPHSWPIDELETPGHRSRVSLPKQWGERCSVHSSLRNIGSQDAPSDNQFLCDYLRPCPI
jgi:hypothetical protein